MALVLWLLAVTLVIAGILALTRKQYRWGHLALGPSGVSLSTRR